MSAEYPMYALSEEHQAIREAVRAVCDAKVAPYATDVDENARYPQEAADALQVGYKTLIAKLREYGLDS